MKAIYKVSMPVLTAAIVFATVTAIAQPSKAVKADNAQMAVQMAAEKASLQRALKRLEADEATLKADKASGKMAAESTDSLNVYNDQQDVKGTKKVIADDKAKMRADTKAGKEENAQMKAQMKAQMQAQMASDKAGLQRVLKRLEADEATLKADKASGKMAAESPDSFKGYQDQQDVKGTKKVIADDKAKMQADTKK